MQMNRKASNPKFLCGAREREHNEDNISFIIMKRMRLFVGAQPVVLKGCTRTLIN